MARVSRRPVSAFTKHAQSRAARKHKIILESVTQKKKKLRSVISFEAEAPPGYTFIPAGNPHLTNACKEICRKDGLKVLAVTTTPHMNTHNLSQHVHRIGYHFPSAVVANVCMDLGLYLSATGKAVAFQSFENTRTHLTDSDVSQITINTEARDVLRDLFPNIPDNDLNQIIKTAFQKGQRKVGTAVELPLARRAQLAVVAHIRHVYTDYDRLLKRTSFHDARSLVEDSTLAKLVEWRGDDENGKTVLEDVFREVIVISDDEESDMEGDVAQPSDRDYSVEFVSGHPRVEELQAKPPNFVTHNQDLQLDPLETEVPPGFRFIPETSRKEKINRRGFSRYQAWDRAINRYRNIANDTDPDGPNNRLDDYRGLFAMQKPSNRSAQLDRGFASRSFVGSPVNIVAVNDRPSTSAANHSIERRPCEIYDLTESPKERMKDAPLPNICPRGLTPITRPDKFLARRAESPNGPVFVSGPGKSFEKKGDFVWPHPRAPSGVSTHNQILPSIEAPVPVESEHPQGGQVDNLVNRISGDLSICSLTPPQPRPNNSRRRLEDSLHDPASKRRHTAYHDPAKKRSEITTAPSIRAHPAEQCIHAGNVFRGRNLSHDGPMIRGRLCVAEPQPATNRVCPTVDNVPRPDIPFHKGALEGQEDQFSRDWYSRLDPVCKPVGNTRLLPDASFGYPVDSGRKPVLSVRYSDFGDRPINQCGPLRNFDNTREVENQQLLESNWRKSHDNSVLVAPGKNQRKKHYADDFVRAVDLCDPVPMGESARHATQMDHFEEPIPIQLLGDHHHGRHQPCSMASRLHPSQTQQPDPRIRPVNHFYAPVDERIRNPYDHRSLEFLPEGSQHARRDEVFLGSSRKPYECQQQVPRAGELYSPTYTRRIEQAQQEHPTSDGRTIVIVD